MCGIVGYIGKGNAQEILVAGLKKLEYRGYDSAGIYVVDENKKGHLFRETGHIAALKEKVNFDILAHQGIGHTRWATHGEPSIENAHPHQSPKGRFTLVHNGVIENFRELNETYLEDVALNGQTDTEIAVAVIEYFAEKDNLSGKEAFKKALEVITGSFAFVLIDKETPNTLYAAKNKSPLLIAKGDTFNGIVSDAIAMIQLTNQYVEIHDGELVIVTADKVTIETLDGTIMERDAYTAHLDSSDLEKGTYPFYMLKEIDEQPGVMRKIVKEYSDGKGGFNVDAALLEELAAADRIHIIACGTSYNAGWVGKSLFENIAKIPTEVHLSSEFSYNTPLIQGKPFFIYLSQSGETADSRQVLVKTNEWNYPAVTITNVPGSTLSREAKYTLLLHAGPEIAVASTKAYTGQIAVQAMLCEILAKTRGVQTEIDMAHELSIVANAMDVIINDKETIHNFAIDYVQSARNAFYIGRGLDYCVCMESSLKLKEISYIQAEGFAAGELKHGTIALIEPGTPVLAIITQKNVASHTRGNVEEVRSRGANTLIFAMEGLEKKGDQFVMPAVHPALTPLLAVVPGQLFAYYATLERGYDVDKPRNLAKSVTVE
ncbi:MAG: glutamine--fructose-6-phosphate transaminase (isomerizing) [Trichococcus sp.]